MPTHSATTGKDSTCRNDRHTHGRDELPADDSEAVERNGGDVKAAENFDNVTVLTALPPI